MELGLAVAALIAAGIALGLGVRLQRALESVQAMARATSLQGAQARDNLDDARREMTQAIRAAEAADLMVVGLQAAVAQLRAELGRIRAALETPPPPLPKSRTGSLEDLRQRLRAEQQEPGDDDEGPV